MKVFVSTRNGLDGLALVERPIPTPGPHQLLLRMRAASLNYRDLDVLRGDYADFPRPFVPISDGVGEVVAIGAGVRRFAVGDRASPAYLIDWVSGEPTEELRRRRLGGPDDGVLAEYVCVEEHALVAPPRHLTDVEAATLPIAGVTAWDALFVSSQVTPGDVVVVQGTGGVSLFALTLARLAGARVIVTSGSPAKLARALALGAEHGIDYRAEPAWHERVLALTGGRGADHVIDVAGGEGLARSLAATRVGGTVSLAGFVTGKTARIALPTVMQRRLRLQGLGVGSRASFEGLVRTLEASGARPVVDRVFPLAEARAALAYLESGAPFGKVAIAFA
jgi:NADPH:quinone reductase-like Zn-dependent oxidoreductase